MATGGSVALTLSEGVQWGGAWSPLAAVKEQTWVRARTGRPARQPLCASRWGMERFQSQVSFEGNTDRTWQPGMRQRGAWDTPEFLA